MWQLSVQQSSLLVFFCIKGNFRGVDNVLFSCLKLFISSHLLKINPQPLSCKSPTCSIGDWPRILLTGQPCLGQPEGACLWEPKQERTLAVGTVSSCSCAVRMDMWPPFVGMTWCDRSYSFTQATMGISPIVYIAHLWRSQIGARGKLKLSKWPPGRLG